MALPIPLPFSTTGPEIAGDWTIEKAEVVEVGAALVVVTLEGVIVLVVVDAPAGDEVPQELSASADASRMVGL